MENVLFVGKDETSYWNLLKDLSAEVKLRLIARLSASLVRSAERQDGNIADKYYGAWIDDKSAEAMADDIRKSRVNGERTIESFE